MSEYWHIVSSRLGPPRGSKMSSDCVNFDSKWCRAIKKAVRANYKLLLVKKACNQGHASLDELLEARKCQAAAGAMLNIARKQCKRQRKH